jgi:acylphosphatase
MVMYRDFATRSARGLRLTGTVKNMHDSSVVVVAEGEEATLARFIEKLKRGSLLSHVEDVAVFWEEATGEFSDFHIVYV